jgi:uncharacterized radical SAM protein YgiQ
MSFNENRFLPTSVKEMEALGWKYADVIIFSGDAYVDHPSFGTAVIGRMLSASGYKVAVVPQPNWRDDLRDFKKFGVPRLFFGVTSGAMDSMVNHYTANKRLRSDDAYTPGGIAGRRPDYAVNVYTGILKNLYPEVPVIIGGIEASLRRFTHYDYWQDKLLPSILISSGADLLVYGMGEKQILEIASRLRVKRDIRALDGIPQTAILRDMIPENCDTLLLEPFDRLIKNKILFAENFKKIESEADRYNQRVIAEPSGDKFVIVYPPYPVPETSEIDSWYELPYTKLPHPRYKDKHIPAYEMIKFSINTHRGCFGACSFCTISAHQGKFVVSRSEESVLEEICKLTELPGFKGVISDIGGPTANMYGMKGRDLLQCEKCRRSSCIYPGICRNLDISHEKLLSLYSKIEEIKGVKRAFIGSGIRYDLFLDEKGYLDESGRRYLEEVVKRHTSGRLKVAPEHTEPSVLKAMGKPSFGQFVFLRNEFEKIIKRENLRYEIIPYFISSHPGCTMEDMKKLSLNSSLKGIRLEQVQDFTPTPMTRSAAMFYSGINPDDGKKLYVEKNPADKLKQKNFFINKY